MYCENCGAQVGENYRFCPSCGKPFTYSVIRPGAQRRSRVQDHIQLLGVLWIAAGALAVLGAIAVVTVAHTILAFVLRPDLGVPGEVFPLVRTIIQALSDAPGGKLSRDFFLDLLGHSFTRDQARAQLDIAIDWGRYGELYTYHAHDHQLALTGAAGSAVGRPPV